MDVCGLFIMKVEKRSVRDILGTFCDKQFASSFTGMQFFLGLHTDFFDCANKCPKV